MNILFYVLANKQTGLGHFVRSLALADEAQRQGHNVIFLSDRNPKRSFAYRAISTYTVGEFIAQAEPCDWVIIDLPQDNKKLTNYAARFGKVCLINGVGHEHNGADLIISQGPEGEYAAPDYLILRPGVFTRCNQQPGGPWLVFGGSADNLGLLRAFHSHCQDWSAQLLINPMIKMDWFVPFADHWLLESMDDSLFNVMAESGAACISMGMIVYELCAIGIPTYVFSKTERHLKTALILQKWGWIRAWPEVGLPEGDEFKAFLAEPFEPVKAGIPADGAGRVLQLLELKLR